VSQKMKYINIVIAFFVGLFVSSTLSIAEEITIDNPYKNISIKYAYKYSSISSSSKEIREQGDMGEFTINESIKNEEIGNKMNMVTISIILENPKTGAEKILDTQKYDATHGENLKTEIHEKEFALKNGKSGLVSYKTNIEVDDKMIKSIETEILKVSIDGTEIARKDGTVKGEL
jgi:hypothetical protein